MLAYITPGEANTLEKLGGQKTMTPEGIPAYPPPGEKGGPGSGSEGRAPGQGQGGGEITKPKITYRTPVVNPFEETGQTPQEKRALDKAIGLSQATGSYVPTLGMYRPPNMAQKIYNNSTLGRVFNPYFNKADILKRKLKKLRDKNFDYESDAYDIEDSIGSPSMVLTKAINLAEGNMLSQSDFEGLMNYQNQETGRDGNLNILPQYSMMGGGADMGSVDAVEPYNQFTYDDNAFGPGGDSADVTRASYDFNQGGRARRAEGGIMGLRARKAFGGIMDRVTGRKAYGLGSIFKSVKNAVGKVLKSDVGKAAILGFGMFGVPGGTGFTGGLLKSGVIPAGLKNKLFMKNLAEKGAKAMYTGEGAGLDWLKLAGIGLTAAPFIEGAPWNKVKEDPSLMATRADTQLIDPITGEPNNMAGMRENIELAKLEADGDPIKLAAIDAKYNNMLNLGQHYPYQTYGVKDGGRIGKAEGGLLDMGGMEKDYRAEGGFVPIGEYEKKDDVPARLSVNEFVFTADAVRGAGQGDIDKGAEIMENMMENLEKGGTVSEESQGNAGAQQMFDTSERLGEVI